MDFSTKSVCVVDNGHFIEFAIRLAKDFGKTYYWSPWQNSFPTSNQLVVGKGISNIERVDSIWTMLDKIDLFVFPDLYYANEQEFLKSIGKRVWGSQHGEELELNRLFLKKVLDRLDLPVTPYEMVTGLTALRAHLKESEDRYVKVSRIRGDMETFYSKNLDQVAPLLDSLGVSLGMRKETIPFMVEEPLPPVVEVGCDIYTVDGKYPGTALCGIEIKDRGYIGHAQPYTDIAEPFKIVNDKFADVLAEYKYRNFWCPEMAVSEDGTPYVMDPCCRAGSPPSELELLLITNLAEVMWHGAEGDLVDWTPAGEWGALAHINSTWAPEKWQPIEFPEKLRDNIKLRYLTVIDGVNYIVPVGHKLGGIGSVVAHGKTPQEAMNNVAAIASEISGYCVSVDTACLPDAQERINTFKEYGFDL